MTKTFRAACLQVSPGNDLAANLAEIAHLTGEVTGQGAALIALPEFAAFLDRDSRAMRWVAQQGPQSEALAFLRDLACRHGIWLLVGSLVVLTEDDPSARLANRSFLIAPTGETAATYDKVHLFDATLPDGRVVGESRHYAGGSKAAVVETELAIFGLSICYDIRFPQLYRQLALAGAQVLMIPAAFTAETGAMHWEPLLRARAIETGSYVLAPATSGTHPGNWQTWGHATIIDPWGRLIAQCGDQLSGYCMAEIDIAQSASARSRIPSLNTNPRFDVVRHRWPTH